MEGIAEHGPEPQLQPAESRQVGPEEDKVAGFVFKVQANMDPKHRDRVAFVRLASGHFLPRHEAGCMSALEDNRWRYSNPVLVPRFRPANWPRKPGPAYISSGIPNHGQLRIERRADRGRGAALPPLSRLFAPELRHDLPAPADPDEGPSTSTRR